MSVTVASEQKYIVAEGPHWVGNQNILLHVDVEGHSICRLDPETKKTDVLTFDDSVSLVIPIENNPKKLLFSVGAELKIMDEWGGSTHKLATSEKGKSPTRFNDGKCDVMGRLWTGTMALETSPGVLEPEQGALYSLGRGRDITKHVDKVSISNGIAWTSDNRIMYYVDSYVRRVYAFDYDLQNGSVSNQRIVVDFNKTPGYDGCGLPDGMTIDVTNNIWVACYNAGQVIKIDPQTGELLRTIKFPASRITSCCFGGVNYDELYVTSAYNFLTEEQLRAEPQAGSIFVVKGLGSKGTQLNSFSE